MRWIENILDNLRPHFEKGKTLHPFKALFDAMDVFFFTPKTTVSIGAHFRDPIDLKRGLTTVMIALVPCILFGIWNIGYQHYLSLNYDANFWRIILYGLYKFLPMVIVTYVSGLTVEIIVAQLKNEEVAEGFFVTGLIVPLIMPPDIPLWMLSVAVIFAVIFSKEVFGGTGMNFLNPAIVTRVFLFFAYPAEISGDSVWIAEKADAFSGATPLAALSLGSADLPAIKDLVIGTIPGSIGETSKIAILLGALLLIFTKVASLKIMLSAIIGALSCGFLFNLIGGNDYMEIPAYYHLLCGGFLFGAVFMATDPVTAAQTSLGKIIYGFLIGVLCVCIRVLNKGYAEGMMLAIMLMNVFAPLIDYYVILYHRKKRVKRWRQTLVSTSNQN